MTGVSVMSLRDQKLGAETLCRADITRPGPGATQNQGRLKHRDESVTARAWGEK